MDWKGPMGGIDAMFSFVHSGRFTGGYSTRGVVTVVKVRHGKRMMVTALVTGGMAASFGWAQLVSSPAHAAGPPPAQVKVVDAPDPDPPQGVEPADLPAEVRPAGNW